ncbi:hypothetical protein UPYG_G00325630 [Umbra pygmaea]|uniref:Myelin and lymphocyte protein n=1 Tax=Umbra pygmaea TaxID=75934 RepID=A0ABD0W173_UMBPY
MASNDLMPSGCRVLATLPDLFFIPEFVFGGLVWTLVASTYVTFPNPEGWVMFVSVFCFLFTTILFFIFISGNNQSSMWPGLDASYHALAAILYLSASVLQASTTIGVRELTLLDPTSGNPFNKIYKLEIAAVVMAFTVTLFYTLHAIFSVKRWKKS